MQIIGLMGSCIVISLIAAVLLVRAPFQMVSWTLGLVLEGLGALCAWLERVG